MNQSYHKAFSDSRLFISVSGIIGAGKTTLVKKLAEETSYDPIFEPVDNNPYLADFYKEINVINQELKEAKTEDEKKKIKLKARYPFIMQICLLNKRFKQHQSVVWSNKPAIQDRSIYEDPIFAKMLFDDGFISELDFETYREAFINMTNFLHRPDLIIFLDVKPEVALKRKEDRKRVCESGVTIEYLRSLQTGYEDWIADINSRIPILRIDYNEFLSLDKIKNLIEEFVVKNHIGKSIFKF